MYIVHVIVCQIYFFRYIFFRLIYIYINLYIFYILLRESMPGMEKVLNYFYHNVNLQYFPETRMYEAERSL